MDCRVKIYRHDQGITLVGKAWEIRAKLKEYGNIYSTVNEWVQNEKHNKKKRNRRGTFTNNTFN